MTNRVTKRAAAAAFGGLVLLGAVGAAPASAKGGGRDVRAAGTCTARSTSKIKAKLDDGRIEVETEADSNRVGQTWSVRLTDQGVQVFSGTATTTAPSGSFEVERRIADRAGTDTLVATASNAATGETCRAAVSL